MFNMSDLWIEMWSNGTHHTHHIFSFRDASLNWASLNPLEMLHRENWVGKLTFLLSALNLNISFLFNKQMTVISIII